MKTLYLLRHAKSSWKYPELTDQARPLNKRGKRDAPIMGNWLKQQGVVPESMISSPAARTLATINLVAHALGLSGEAIETDLRLYHASLETLLAVIQSFPREVNSLMVVGHNPGLTELANHLCPAHATDNISTCGLYAVELRATHWQEAGAENASFLFFKYPRNIGQ